MPIWVKSMFMWIGLIWCVWSGIALLLVLSLSVVFSSAKKRLKRFETQAKKAMWKTADKE